MGVVRPRSQHRVSSFLQGAVVRASRQREKRLSGVIRPRGPVGFRKRRWCSGCEVGKLRFRPESASDLIGLRSSGAPGRRSTTGSTTLPARGGRPGNAQLRVSACLARQGTSRSGQERPEVTLPRWTSRVQVPSPAQPTKPLFRGRRRLVTDPEVHFGMCARGVEHTREHTVDVTAGHGQSHDEDAQS